MSEHDVKPLVEGLIEITATAVATHPDGTVLDENGHPVLPEE